MSQRTLGIETSKRRLEAEVLSFAMNFQACFLVVTLAVTCEIIHDDDGPAKNQTWTLMP